MAAKTKTGLVGAVIGVAVVLLLIALPLAYLMLRNSQGTDSVSAIIVPHHNLVADYRSRTFDKIAPRTQGRTIILLSPNHYDNGLSDIQTTGTNFTTEYGDIEIDQAMLNFAKQSGAQEVATTFEIEHGIKALLPDIAKYYPDSKVLPLIFSEGMNKSISIEMMNSLFKSFPNCLFLTSADLSHYQPYKLSELHDKLTIRSLTTLNHDSLPLL